jgi:signal transduction histidine kinase
LHQPLSAIRNYAHASRLQQGPAGSSDLPEKIEHEAARAAEVVQRLRDFFRDGSSSFEYMNVQRLIDGALSPMRADAAKQDITLSSGTFLRKCRPADRPRAARGSDTQPGRAMLSIPSPGQGSAFAPCAFAPA